MSLTLFSSNGTSLCIYLSLSGKCVKIQRKQGLSSSMDSSSNKHSPSNKRSGAPSPVALRPLRDRIIHVLALKAYRKPELLLWLERERASPKDKADLGAVLDDVRPLEHDTTLKLYSGTRLQVHVRRWFH